MENLSLYIFIGITVPLSATVLICRGNSRLSMLFVVIGMLVCLFAGEVNALLYRVSLLPMNFYAVNVSPLIEELCKSVPLFLYAYILHPKKQTILQCAVSLGVGFAIFENTAVFAQSYAALRFLDVLMRGFGSGLMHAITTLWIGSGIILIFLNRKLFYTGSAAILITAAIFHSIYNALIGSRLEIAGLLLPVSTLIPLTELLVRRIINKKSDHGRMIHHEE